MPLSIQASLTSFAARLGQKTSKARLLLDRMPYGYCPASPEKYLDLYTAVKCYSDKINLRNYRKLQRAFFALPKPRLPVKYSAFGRQKLHFSSQLPSGQAVHYQRRTSSTDITSKPFDIIKLRNCST